jgi:hypothetical protein
MNRAITALVSAEGGNGTAEDYADSRLFPFFLARSAGSAVFPHGSKNFRSRQAVNRDRGASRDAAPPTPPGVRVRTDGGSAD